MTESRKYTLTLLLWWLAAAYAFALVLHPFLIGCGCSTAGPDHTCGIVQHYASIGSILWTLLLPAGLWLFRKRENMLIFLAITGIMDMFSLDSVAEFTAALILSVPLVPYVGLLPLLGKTASENTLYTLLFLYCLTITAFAIYLYRKNRRSDVRAYSE
ncbi:MAG: hypothetical protein IJX14_11685 [Clostridia bacterium]|nr:hypothetical protein [Clostridia bacterium]